LRRARCCPAALPSRARKIPHACGTALCRPLPRRWRPPRSYPVRIKAVGSTLTPRPISRSAPAPGSTAVPTWSMNC